MRNYSFRPVASSSKDMQPEFFLSQCLSRTTIYFSADSHLQATKYVNFTLIGKFTFLKFGKDVVHIRLWEGIWLSLHIFVGISIGTYNLESPGPNHDTRPNLTIRLAVLLPSNRIFIPGPLQELPLHHA